MNSFQKTVYIKNFRHVKFGLKGITMINLYFLSVFLRLADICGVLSLPTNWLSDKCLLLWK